MTYDEMLAKVADRLGHCRVAGGLHDEDVARQVLADLGLGPKDDEDVAPSKKAAKKGD